MVFEAEVYQDSCSGAICIGLKDFRVGHYTPLTLWQVEQLNMDLFGLEHFDAEKYAEHYGVEEPEEEEVDIPNFAPDRSEMDPSSLASLFSAHGNVAEA